MKNNWQNLPLDKFLKRVKNSIDLQDDIVYKQVTVRLWNKGAVLRGQQSGRDIKTKRQFLVKEGQIVMSRIDARNGAIGLVPKELNDAVVSSDFWVYDCDTNFVFPKFLLLYMSTKGFLAQIDSTSSGTTKRIRAREDEFLNLEMPLPSIEVQKTIVNRIEEISRLVDKAKKIKIETEELSTKLTTSQNEYVLHPRHYPTAKMGTLAQLVKRPSELSNGQQYNGVGVKWWGKGAYIHETKIASDFRAERFEVKTNDVIYNDMWARHGSVGIIDQSLNGSVASAHFPTWELDLDKVFPEFFSWCFRSPWFWAACSEGAQGSTGRNAISKKHFQSILMPLPPLDEQRRIVAYLDSVQARLASLRELQSQTQVELDALLPSVLDRAFKGEL